MVIEIDWLVKSSDLGHLVALVLMKKGNYLIFIQHILVCHFLL